MAFRIVQSILRLSRASILSLTKIVSNASINSFQSLVRHFYIEQTKPIQVYLLLQIKVEIITSQMYMGHST